MGKSTPRPCLAGCGRYVIGRTKLCDDCVPRCDCGQRKRPDRTTCHSCSERASLSAGRIRWHKKPNGIYVAR